jgi:hypothetical protein
MDRLEMARRQAEEDAQADELAQLEGERLQRAAQSEAERAQATRELDESIARLDRTVASIQRRAAEETRTAQNPNAQSRSAQPEQQRVSIGNSVADDSDSTESGQDDANVVYASRGGSADTVGPNRAAGGSSGDTGQRPICATQPFDSPNKAFPQGSAMRITNTCHEPLSVRICLRVEGKWDCGVNWGVPPGAEWSWGSTRVYTGSFWDARLASSNQRLASPGE